MKVGMKVQNFDSLRYQPFLVLLVGSIHFLDGRVSIIYSDSILCTELCRFPTSGRVCLLNSSVSIVLVQFLGPELLQFDSVVGSILATCYDSSSQFFCI